MRHIRNSRPAFSSKGAIARQSALSREHQGPRAVLNALERLAGGYGSECDRIRQDLAIAESQLRDYDTRLGKPFLHERYLSELTGLRDQLKAGLSATAQAQGDETKPTVSELAEKIKTLKAAHTIEAAPQRVRQKHSSAEEPVTARILRRAATAAASEPLIRADDTPRPTGVQPSARHRSVEPTTTFQEQIAKQRQRDGDPNRTL